ncbi:aminotransferase class I/II-fold pyridoxal phosphate-dependent enzyme [Mastigocoleus sp. MO_188.B34]|uniref:pyridoxal phosphate-dependent decarboxylase family protein n=1 Tax=Mastigocoleus sp. MO_188.B34 TaxID=3036635 RepID=UPI002630B502|nr:aminotransferase class I/II-fold pyridoxal phosphate-dependent enzyme [Mastigocoleus sp. MO_188.B34]MDJ0694948.1 aminotransferase class I/II-fold pyridoxal phosphate-dependent enzyme [Mastigocoleus sp. MO_188.B34]
MTLEKQSLNLLQEALEKLDYGFQNLPELDPTPDLETIKPVLLQVAARMQDNFPYHHPLYVGQMLKPPTAIARLAYMLSLWINPNNHALDGGRSSSVMEKEAVGEIARMFGWETHLGHLCSGGTMANLEGLWVASLKQNPKSKILASSQAHYTHKRLCNVLRLPFQSVKCDNQGRMNLSDLEKLLDGGDIGTVVVTMGTTATGSVDPLPEIIELQSQYNFRIHVDAAYGGYFTLIDNLSDRTRAIFDSISQVDSIVIDPHKHGLQPYGCGCILFKDPAVGQFYKHDSPYTYFSSQELHLGEISLECSRPGSAAVALWATQKLLPMVRDGKFAIDLSKSRQAAINLFEKLQSDRKFITAFPPELDIVIWVPKAERVSKASLLSQEIFEKSAAQNLHLALAKFPIEFFQQGDQVDIEWDEKYITCLRSCLMKPEHFDWLDRIWEILDAVTDEVLKTKIF